MLLLPLCPIMTKATKNSAYVNNSLPQADEIVPSSQDELSGQEQEPDPEVSFHQFRPTQPVTSMFMPHIEGLKMDQTAIDGL